MRILYFCAPEKAYMKIQQDNSGKQVCWCTLKNKQVTAGVGTNTELLIREVPELAFGAAPHGFSIFLIT